MQFTGLTRELPLNVHLLTLQSLGGGRYLLRLEHQFEIDEAPWNKPVTLSLAVSCYGSSHMLYIIIIIHLVNYQHRPAGPLRFLGGTLEHMSHPRAAKECPTA